MKSFTQTGSELEELLEFLEKDLENVKRVIETVKDFDMDFEVHAKAETVDESVKHSQLDKNRIIKTLIFKCGEDFVAVMCPGDKRVDENKLSDLTGKKVRMAHPREVKTETGYIVGGVSPFNLNIPIYAAKSIPEGSVRPAGGSRVIGVKTTRSELFELLDPKIAVISEE